MDSFRETINDSIYDLKRVVLPLIYEYRILQGNLVLVEDGDRCLARLLDVYAGIDIIQVLPDKGLVGISSRIQWTKQPYNSFTVRRTSPLGARVEYAKRRDALLSNGKFLLPYYQLQAYITSKKNRRVFIFRHSQN